MNPWTDEEFSEFDRLTQEASTYGVDRAGRRPIARSLLQEFIAKHGEEKCNAMFLALKDFDRGTT